MHWKEIHVESHSSVCCLSDAAQKLVSVQRWWFGATYGEIFGLLDEYYTRTTVEGIIYH